MDKNSATWIMVSKWANDRIEKNQARLEALGTGETATNVCRGEIRSLRALLALADDPVQEEKITIPGYGLQTSP